MGGLTGVMIADYGLTGGNLFIENLYDGSKTNPRYYYSRGWNVQAYIAYIAGLGIGFPGFCGNLGAKVPQVAKELGYLGWILSFTVSITVYVVLCAFWPTQSQRAIKELALRREEMADGIDDFVLSQHELSNGSLVTTEAVSEDLKEPRGVSRVSEV